MINDLSSMQPSMRPSVRPSGPAGVGDDGVALHAQTLVYEAALVAAGTTPDRAGLLRHSRAMRTLEAAGILDDLVLGVYLGSDMQLSSGSPIAYSGSTPATVLIAGTFARGADGFTANQSATQGLAWTIPDTRTGTVIVDTVPGGTVGSTGGGTIAMVQQATGTFWHNSLMWGYNGTDRPQITRLITNGTVSTQTEQVEQGVVARALRRNSRQWSIHGFTYGTTAARVWVNGIESFPQAPNNSAAAHSVAQTRFSLFARMASAAAFSSLDRLVGTIRSAMLFGRELTTTEARAATVAAAILNPAPAMIIIEGDSTAAMSNTPRTLDNWGYQLQINHAGWSPANVIQINIATSGMTAESYDFQNAPFDYMGYAKQCEWFTPAALGKKVIFSIQGGINDVGVNSAGGPYTVAQIYAFMRDYAAKPRAVGAETMIHTMPIPQPTAWNSTQQAKLQAVNAHILANASNDGFDYVVDAATAVDMTNPLNRHDFVHANAAGNKLWADAIAAALPNP